MDKFLEAAKSNLSDPGVWLAVLLIIALLPVAAWLIGLWVNRDQTPEAGKEKAEEFIRENRSKSIR